MITSKAHLVSRIREHILLKFDIPPKLFGLLGVAGALNAGVEFQSLFRILKSPDP